MVGVAVAVAVVKAVAVAVAVVVVGVVVVGVVTRPRHKSNTESQTIWKPFARETKLCRTRRGVPARDFCCCYVRSTISQGDALEKPS